MLIELELASIAYRKAEREEAAALSDLSERRIDKAIAERSGCAETIAQTSKASLDADMEWYRKRTAAKAAAGDLLKALDLDPVRFKEFA